MNAKTEKFNSSDPNSVYRAYQDSRDEQIPANYVSSVMKRRRREESLAILVEAGSDAGVDALYREYQATRDERIGKGISNIMQVVQERREVHAANSQSAPGRTGTLAGLLEKVRDALTRRSTWLMVPSLGVAALAAVMIVPAILGIGTVGPKEFLTYPPSSNVLANAGYLGSMLEDGERVSLGFAGDSSAKSRVFHAGATGVDLVVATGGGHPDKTLTALNQFALLTEDVAAPGLQSKIQADIDTVAAKGLDEKYSAAELLETARKTFNDSGMARAYELGQWTESLLLEAILAAHSNDVAALNDLLSSSTTRENLALLSGRSGIASRLTAKLEDIVNSGSIDVSSAGQIREIASQLKYVY